MSLVFLSLLLAGPLAPAAEAAPVAVSQGALRRVPVGDPQRRVLLDTIRPAIEDRIGQPVQFVVDKLQIQGDWAFYAGRVQQPNGRPIDFSRTPFMNLSTSSSEISRKPGAAALNCSRLPVRTTTER